MNTLKINQFTTVIAVAVLMVASMFIYLAFASFSFQLANIKSESQRLHHFADRSLTRIAVNPERYTRGNFYVIGDENFHLSSNYAIIKSLSKAAPPVDRLKPDSIHIAMERFGGVFSLSSFALIYSITDGNTQFYAYASVNPERYGENLGEILNSHLQPAVTMIGVTVFILFVVQSIQAYRLKKTVIELASWADKISTRKPTNKALGSSSPRFSYLSQAMVTSLSTFSDLLKSEHNFLKYTSHELRSQVSTISANIELLEYMLKDLSNEEKKVLNRMIASIEDMRYQSEALLWLSREEDLDVHNEYCNLYEMFSQAIEENRGSIDRKNITIQLTEKTHHIMSHRALLQIAINNLVRNAVQNTKLGKIEISVMDYGVLISNELQDDSRDPKASRGFGIGLLLVQRICERLDMIYTEKQLSRKWIVEITFQQCHRAR